MDRQTAKEELKRREPDFLKPAKHKVNGHISYICPNCGNGSGSSGDGIAQDPHSPRIKRYKCFVCGLSEDVIGLWKIHNGTVDDKQAFEELYDYYGLEIDKSHTAQEDFKTEYQKEDKSKQYTHNSIHTDTYTHTEKTTNNIDYYKACMEQVSKTDYFKKRGLSEAIISKYMLGYDSSYRTGSKSWEAVIIPTGSSSYVARNTDPEADKKDRYRKTGTSQLYLKNNLVDATSPVFIVEGEIDALSIIEVGGLAVGLGSTANYRQLVDFLKDHRPAQPIILSLDNDEDGEKTTQTLEEELTKLNISFYRYNPYGEAKDANGALTANRETFTEEIKKAIEGAKSTEEAELEAQKEEYIKNSTAYHIQGFIDGIADSVNTPYIPTGFTQFDKILDGGLYEGLYILGAISSLGKTTLALQIADQVAEAGQDVLIFSLEMARSELMAKSISRLTILDVLQNKGSIQDAKTTRGITTGTRYKYYSKTEQELIQRAITAYSNYAKNIYIHEGIGDIGVEQIRGTISKHIHFTGKKPVVLLDYVQILAPADIRATDKQNTDKAVLELKRISRDFKIPIIGISSFNRANYSLAVTMEAFKESGSLEYGSDVLMGLQLKGAGEKGFNVNEAKQRNPREVELVILKNRNGVTGKKIDFEYYPMFNYFKEV
jgi:replicative DNA helicase